MNRGRLGFTIVELLVVIVVIGILAAVVVVGYGAWRNDVIEKQLKSDLNGAASAMENGRNFGTDYPTNLPANFKPSDDVTMTSKSGGGTYCVQATSKTSPNVVFNIKNGKQPAPGACDAYYTAFTKVSIATVCGIEYGKAYCWGEAGYGGSVLGSGTTTNTNRPVAVDTSVMKGKVTAITSSNGTVCAIADSKVYCWGNGTGGLLGNGSTVNSNTPVVVDTSLMRGGVSSIAMGGTTACAIAGGKVYCWGVSNQGQVGNGTTTNSIATPVPVNTSNMSGEVSSISLGTSHACAISEGKAYCWGNSYSNGIGTTSIASVPTAVSTVNMNGQVTKIDSSNGHSCAISSGKAYCWGTGGYSPTAHGHLGSGTISALNVPTAVNTSVMTGTVTELKTNGAITCAIASEKVYCWGENAIGQLGDGTTTTSTVPVAVNTSLMSKKVTAINVDQQSCAISDDKLYCWGAGTAGQLGNGASSSSSLPVAVNTSIMKGKVTAITSGFQFTCATADDRIYCWGVNSKGQLGSGTFASSNTPLLLVPNS